MNSMVVHAPNRYTIAVPHGFPALPEENSHPVMPGRQDHRAAAKPLLTPLFST